LNSVVGHPLRHWSAAVPRGDRGERNWHLLLLSEHRSPALPFGSSAGSPLRHARSEQRAGAAAWWLRTCRDGTRLYIAWAQCAKRPPSTTANGICRNLHYAKWCDIMAICKLQNALLCIHKRKVT